MKNTSYLKIFTGFPVPRVALNCVQNTVDGVCQVFIMGGFRGLDRIIDFWKLNLKTYEWTYFSLCYLPASLFFSGANVTPEGRLYALGGPYESKEGNNQVYSAWLCIPKLSEMCWDAVLHYFPHINKCTMDDLAKIGIPKCFLQRFDRTS